MKIRFSISRVWLFVLVTFLSTNTTAQVVVSFDSQVPYIECSTYRLNDNSMNCYLQLLVNDRYAMYASLAEDDMVCEHILSFGRFSMKNDSLILSDALWGEEMVLSVAQKDFFVRKGFAFMIGKIFLFDKKERSLLHGFVVNTDSLQKIRNQFENNYVHFKKSDYGRYVTNQGCLSLNLDFDNHYSLFFEELLLSEGTVSFYGDIIRFYDEHLDCVFYSGFAKGNIHSCLLPADAYGCTLNKVKKRFKSGLNLKCSRQN